MVSSIFVDRPVGESVGKHGQTNGQIHWANLQKATKRDGSYFAILK